jgi:hypothetical protein
MRIQHIRLTKSETILRPQYISSLKMDLATCSKKTQLHGRFHVHLLVRSGIYGHDVHSIAVPPPVTIDLAERHTGVRRGENICINMVPYFSGKISKEV